MSLGQSSLNLSFLLYLFLYLPQVIHNQKQTSLDGLSIKMHMTLYLAYCLDLLYGFGTQLPWQYLSVSGIGWLLLTIQHVQFIQHFKQKNHGAWQFIFYILLFTFSILLVYGISQKPFSAEEMPYCGYLAQIGFVIAFVPQILKSQRLKSAQAISALFILLNFLLAVLDSISAWQLGWGWPNKLGALLGVLLTTVLMLQYRIYQKS